MDACGEKIAESSCCDSVADALKAAEDPMAGVVWKNVQCRLEASQVLRQGFFKVPILEGSNKHGKYIFIYIIYIYGYFFRGFSQKTVHVFGLVI